MEQKRLGNQGLTVSAMGLGCMGMSDAYGLPTKPSPSRLSTVPWTWGSIPRHVGRLRPVHQRGTGRQGDPRPA